MADGPSAEDAATDLGDSDSRLTRERHKRQDAPFSITSLGTVQDITRRIHEDASVLESHPHHRQQQQHRPPRRNCHTHPHLPRRHPSNANSNNNNNINNNNNSNNGNNNNTNSNNNNNNNNSNSNNNTNHHHHHHYRCRGHEDDEVDCNERVSKNESDRGAGVDTMRDGSFTSPTSGDYDEDDDGYDEDDGAEGYEEDVAVKGMNGSRKRGLSKKYRGGVRIDVTKTLKIEESDSDNSNSNGNGSSNNNSKSGGEGGAMTGHATRGDNAGCPVGDGRRSRTAVVAAFLDANTPNGHASGTNECRVVHRDNNDDDDEDEDDVEEEEEEEEEEEDDDDEDEDDDDDD
ncbi:uncharacterized protein LOC143429322, partial [Xylocopa sonorina]|uniref:uncharacterized protein LOC143429322 n=1 Tax=Xylocopa sonorina TaxID=1818115 RepID=UPI00403AF517